MSKKALVKFDKNRPDKKNSDFVAPIETKEGIFELVSLKNGMAAKYGLVVYTGATIDENEIFAKLVDSGQKIHSVQRVLFNFRAFVEKLDQLKIGDVVEINTNNEQNFELIKTNHKARSSKARGLP